MGPVIITAGGTSENIDDIRSISNISTGRMSLAICMKLLHALPKSDIYYLCSQTAIKPYILIQNIHILPVSNTKALFNTLMALDKKGIRPFAIIHAMAVSDFIPEFAAGKISSDTTDLKITFKPNPKVIDLMKDIWPNAILFGFKLESNIDRIKLKTKAKNLMKRSLADYVIMNLKEDISTFLHKGQIIDRSHRITHFYSKSHCADIILNILLNRLTA